MDFSKGLHNMLHKLEWLKINNFLNYNYDVVITSIP